MKQFIFTLIFILTVSIQTYSQTFTHSGTIRTEGNVGVSGVSVKLYKRTTPTLTGFTSQTNYNGHSYYRSTSSMTWTNARTACANMGGHLVTITSAAENTFVFNTWPSGWIGFTDEVVEGQWRWVTGEPVTYTNWNGGEPNNSNNEDYAQFVTGGRWNDLPNVSLPYVLEFDYIVTTTAWVLEVTSTTNSSGQYSFSLPTNPSIEWYIEVVIPTVSSNLSSFDFDGPADVVLGRVSLKPYHYHKSDLNVDGKITVGDVCIVADRINGTPFTKSTLLFTNTQWTSLNSGTSDLRTTIPGITTSYTFTPTSGGTSNFYLLSPGYNNQGLLTY
jgi:hypothetical protein